MISFEVVLFLSTVGVSEGGRDEGIKVQFLEIVTVGFRCLLLTDDLVMMSEKLCSPHTKHTPRSKGCVQFSRLFFIPNGTILDHISKAFAG